MAFKDESGFAALNLNAIFNGKEKPMSISQIVSKPIILEALLKARHASNIGSLDDIAEGAAHAVIAKLESEGVPCDAIIEGEVHVELPERPGDDFEAQAELALQHL